MKLALKDWVTLAGASCGFLAIVAARYYSPWLAVGFVLAAVFFDALDGRVARRSKPDAFGRELDSLADAVSFGVAPAIIIFEAGAGFQGVTGAFALLAAAVWYCGCALARLARFNLSGAYEGLPSPVAAVGVLAASFTVPSLAWLWLLGAGALMVAGFKVRKPCRP